MLNFNSILAAKDYQTQTIPVPEWGGDCLIRTLTADERDRFDTALQSEDKNKAYLLVALSLCDEEGNRIIPDEQIKELGTKNGKVIERLAVAALQLNGYTKQTTEDAKKNSNPKPSKRNTQSVEN